MTPKPDDRLVPSQDEFDAWTQLPVTRFVAAAWAFAAEQQAREWERMFHQRLIPADIATTRLELKTREDAYKAFLETDLDAYHAILFPAAPDARSACLPRGARPNR